ncbi:type II toxin-antitoxin system VapC family toxin [Mucilaginibacter arboris]|uniref:PIN domain-containing protein n=1 Tax=Mucilaginibacter arboris TaxID=2682090 RepID=A0A7K1SXX8_9SPHI|nr:type II toxin-antitoxin system VapC family toxin [Mucilaginibacter arboris]MVN22172.1 PIN domain-containing protein [Mucilaginibacter arboris]
MERLKYLIDSNSVIDYLGNKIPTYGMAFMNEVFNKMNPSISIITKIEVLGFNAPEEHTQLLRDAIKNIDVIDLNSAIADRTILIRKLHKMKLPDAIISATALEYGLILITRNISDFRNLAGLTIIDPHQFSV